MPEGPSIVILKEEASAFAGKKILRASGNSKIDKTRLVGQRIVALCTWGKHFLIELTGFSLRIHLLLYGRYTINERKEAPPRLSLGFSKGELNFYNCSVGYIEKDLNEIYDWSADVMSDEWNPDAALKKLSTMPDKLACDAVLDQTVFSGAGNIFKNEVLFRIQVHPLSKIGALPPTKLRELVKQIRAYAFEFLAWKKAFVLKQHWLAHTKSVCPRCNIPFSRAHLGNTNRRSFFCNRCQKKYSSFRSPQHSKRARTGRNHVTKQRKTSTKAKAPDAQGS